MMQPLFDQLNQAGQTRFGSHWLFERNGFYTREAVAWMCGEDIGEISTDSTCFSSSALKIALQALSRENDLLYSFARSGIDEKSARSLLD